MITGFSPAPGEPTDKNIYLALGFHINLNHSYRLDTNDEAGFGKDIRIIRRTIRILDDFNKRSLRVKAVWDIDNLFSLQEILPRYAPDIIRSLKRRVALHGDEVIIMSYNNGLASAMNRREFRASIQKALTNPEKSGLQDLFGSVSPIVRPQEMMVTPGHFSLYTEIGVQALVLYYSAIPFDAFRVFTEPLSPAEALNPLLYANSQTGESMTVIPAYTIGDLLENTSLECWLRRLKRGQARGEIDNDLLLFINFDADDEYWVGYDVPWHLDWLPNTGGLEDLIEEALRVGDIKFTTLGAYLDRHPPLKKISFGQDTADGSYNGYNSWAEKSTSPLYWTQVVKDRRRHLLLDKTAKFLGLDALPRDIEAKARRSFDLRLRLQSTTNYGMSVPFVTGQREQSAESIIREMNAVSGEVVAWVSTAIRRQLAETRPPHPPRPNMRYLDHLLLLTGSSDNRSVYGGSLRLNLSGGKVTSADSFYLVDPAGKPIPLELSKAEKDENGFITKASLLLPPDIEVSDDVYSLFTCPGDSAITDVDPLYEKTATPESNTIDLKFSQNGLVSGVSVDGVLRLGQGSLMPMIRFESDGHLQEYRPEHLAVTKRERGPFGPPAYEVRGHFTLPGSVSRRSGRIDYTLTPVKGRALLMVEGEITYPETEPWDLLTNGDPKLMKRYDPRWLEVAPLELVWTQKTGVQNPFVIWKRNHLGIRSSYMVDYYRHSPSNLNLSNVNNHITAEYVGAATEESGLAVAMDSSVLASFAFCPLKMSFREDSGLSLKLNPFGTYFGDQYRPPTWGNRHGYKAALLAGGQYHSSAPSYNGITRRFSVMISFFDGPRIPDSVEKALIGFAHPPLIVTGGRIETWDPSDQRSPELLPPRGLLAASADEGVYLHWGKSRDRTTRYKVYYGRQSGRYESEAMVANAPLLLTDLKSGDRYYAVISGVDETGEESSLSREISFVVGEPVTKPELKLPPAFQLKLLFTGIMEKLANNLL